MPLWRSTRRCTASTVPGVRQDRATASDVLHPGELHGREPSQLGDHARLPFETLGDDDRSALRGDRRAKTHHDFRQRLGELGTVGIERVESCQDFRVDQKSTDHPVAKKPSGSVELIPRDAGSFPWGCHRAQRSGARSSGDRARVTQELAVGGGEVLLLALVLPAEGPRLQTSA